jgi:hypothetical protein
MKDYKTISEKQAEIIEQYKITSKFSDASRYHEGIIAKVKLRQLESELAELQSQAEVTDNKLLNHFFEEEYFLEHWIIQTELDDGASKTYERMEKRLIWVQDQIKSQTPDTVK